MWPSRLRPRKPLTHVDLRWRVVQSWFWVLAAACVSFIAVSFGHAWPRPRQSFAWDMKYVEKDDGTLISWTEWWQEHVEKEPITLTGSSVRLPAARSSESFGETVEGTFLFRYEQPRLWPLPPLIQSAHATLQCMRSSGHEFNGDRGPFRRAVRDRMLDDVSRTVDSSGSRAGRSLARQYALVGFGDADRAVTRPYWPGITYSALVLAPLCAWLVAAVSRAIGGTRGLKRSPAGEPLCGRCLYPLGVSGCGACPECGTSVQWPGRGAGP